MLRLRLRCPVACGGAWVENKQRRPPLWSGPRGSVQLFVGTPCPFLLGRHHLQSLFARDVDTLRPPRSQGVCCAAGTCIRNPLPCVTLHPQP